MLHTYAALADKERAVISDRTRAALAQKKAQGVVPSNRTILADASNKGADANQAAADAFSANPAAGGAADPGQRSKGLPRHRDCAQSPRGADSTGRRSTYDHGAESVEPGALRPLIGTGSRSAVA
jgi:hypothetical protein